jgi:4-hydroxythreonine-4-phosphate dehydrogenase
MVIAATSSQTSTIDTNRPRLAIAAGDPGGIGMEIILKALASSDGSADKLISPQTAPELTIVGNRDLLLQTYNHLTQQPHLKQALADPEQLSILDVPLAASVQAQIQPGQGNAASGAASFQFLETAIAQTLAGRFDGIVTAPIAKSAWKAAGHNYPGQTELLAARAAVERFGMLFVARSPHTGWTLRTLLATTHIPLRQVPEVLSPDLMTLKLELLIDSLRQDFGLAQPRIAIAGLNPHSGEQGQLGQEEQTWLIPWLEQVGARFPEVELRGPIPPDTLWVQPGKAWFHGANADDAYIALYHDQGLIPVKLMAFDQAVNTTIGLPFVRTSPDHGTAFDIAGRGIAQADSFKAAIQIAVELVKQRQK